jgi:hypothetical protein
MMAADYIVNLLVVACLSGAGGFLSQEVVKAVSKIGDPMLNVFVFSATDFVGKAFEAVPK